MVVAQTKPGQSPVRHPPLPTKSRGRSAVSNGKLYGVNGGVDYRGSQVRRTRDIIALHLSDLGGEANCSESELALVRVVAQLRVQLEAMERHWAERSDGRAKLGELRTYQSVSGALRRLLRELGLKRRAKQVGPSLGEVLRQGIIEGEQS
jgi:hypothetical protein